MINDQELAKAHENFAFLHCQDLTTYLMGTDPESRQPVVPVPRLLGFREERLRGLNGLYLADAHT